MMKNYNEYSSLDFVEDSSFIQWVIHPDGESDAFWQKWIKEHPDKRDAIMEARKVVSAIRFQENPAEKSMIDSLWQRIDDSISLDQRPKSPRIRRLYVSLSAAAAVILILLVIVLPQAGGKITSHKADLVSEILPDRSSILLNSNSRLTYNKEWTTERRVSLTGEAFFDVEEDTTPFIIETRHGSVEVLGTSFNVYARRDGFSVSCKTGRVKVTSADGKYETVLTPGVKSSLNRLSGQLETSEIDLEKIGSWREGSFYFDRSPLRSVFEEVERQFDVDIRFSGNVGERIYSGGFTTENLDSALYSITWPMRLAAEWHGKKVRIVRTEK